MQRSSGLCVFAVGYGGQLDNRLASRLESSNGVDSICSRHTAYYCQAQESGGCRHRRGRGHHPGLALMDF